MGDVPEEDSLGQGPVSRGTPAPGSCSGLCSILAPPSIGQQLISCLLQGCHLPQHPSGEGPAEGHLSAQRADPECKSSASRPPHPNLLLGTLRSGHLLAHYLSLCTSSTPLGLNKDAGI
jgi:hypothetical protein